MVDINIQFKKFIDNGGSSGSVGDYGQKKDNKTAYYLTVLYVHYIQYTVLLTTYNSMLINNCCFLSSTIVMHYIGDIGNDMNFSVNQSVFAQFINFF